MTVQDIQKGIDRERARKQNALVLYMLKKGMQFTQGDVYGPPYNIHSLTARIAALRKLGFPIVSTPVHDGVSRGIRYSLTETKEDTKAKRYLLNRLLNGEILTVDNVPEMDEKTLDKYARWLVADGWHVLIVDVDGVKSRLYVMPTEGADNGD